jgi:Na+/H+ antiporter NhaC
MRPLTDLLYISREKLAFIVDATAAPIASILPVSSWVGFEVGLIQDEIDSTCAVRADLRRLPPVLNVDHHAHFIAFP